MISGILLAAGRSQRFGDANKLTATWRDKPLVRHVYDAAKASQLDELVVVTGHEADQITELLPDARLVHNNDFQTGMASSIGVGVSSLSNADGILILLGDMPLLTSAHIDSMLAAFDGKPDSIVIATNGGKIGNPVLFGKAHFEALNLLTGDKGARDLIEQSEKVRKVEIGEAAARDFDTPERFSER